MKQYLLDRIKRHICICHTTHIICECWKWWIPSDRNNGFRSSSCLSIHGVLTLITFARIRIRALRVIFQFGDQSRSANESHNGAFCCTNNKHSINLRRLKCIALLDSFYYSRYTYPLRISDLNLYYKFLSTLGYLPSRSQDLRLVNFR